MQSQKVILNSYQKLVDPQTSANERNSSRKWRKTAKAVVQDDDLDLE